MYCLSGWGDWGASYVAETELYMETNTEYTHCPIILCGLAKEAELKRTGWTKNAPLSQCVVGLVYK